MSHPTNENVTRRDFIQTAAGSAAIAASRLNLSAAENNQQPLPTVVLGKTGERVTRLGLGTAPAGHRSRKDAAQFFEQAIQAGVTYMDTAPDFAGYGLAQKALGDVLKDPKVRKKVFLVTKCYEPDGEKALALLKRNLEELQTDYADLVYAHSIGADKMDLKTVLGKGGVMQALAKAQKDGLCRFVGISGHNRPEKFLRVMEEYDVQVMMNAVNFVSRHIYNFEERVWPDARKQNIGLVAMKVLGGQQKKKSDPPDQPRSKGGRIRGDQTEMAFRYAMGLPGCQAVVLGCYDLPELQEAIGWTRNFKPLSDDEQQELLAQGQKQVEEWGEVYGPVAWKPEPNAQPSKRG